MSAYEQASISAGEGADPLTHDEMTVIAEDRLEALGESLAKLRNEWVGARAALGVERRWRDDTDQYLGRDEATKAANQTVVDSALNGGFSANQKDVKPQRSTVFVNITRPKTNAAEARLANMLIPTDDRNWGLQHTPQPDMLAAAKEQAERNLVMPPQLDAQGQLEKAGKAASAMQDEIDDQLNECEYNGELRAMLHDCAVLGTGIMKGPVVVNLASKVWSPKTDAQGTVHVLEIVEKTVPASERVDPWNVFTDPAAGDDIHAGRGIFERGTYTEKQLRELVKQPGYIKENISKVLDEGPTNDEYSSRHGEELTSAQEHFEGWEYWGEFSPDDLRAAGVDIEDGSTELVSGCVIFVNNTVIKGFLNPIETGDMPYDFMVWEKADNSPWGYGVPFLCRPAQRVLNAAWRQLMDNSGLSVGPNIVLDPTKIQPADGRWEITGRKIWHLMDGSEDASKVFAKFEFENHGQEIQQIIELALKFIDEESGVPMLMQGEKGTAPETVGGMQMLMNSSNVVLGRMAKQFDDSITRPHITRYYDWNMAYNENEEIKGDFQVDARGTSALLVRDVQQQALFQLGSFQASPIIGPIVNWDSWFREVLKASHIDPTGIMKTEAEIAQLRNAPPQPPPEVAVTQMKIQGDLEKVKETNASRERIAAQDMDRDTIFAQSQNERDRDNNDYRNRELDLKLQLAQLDYAKQHNLTLEQVKAQLAETVMKLNVQKELSVADHTVDIHKHHSSQVIAPPTEPAGRAPAGEAYEA